VKRVLSARERYALLMAQLYIHCGRTMVVLSLLQ